MTELEQKKKKILDFFRSAFLVDGEVKIDTDTNKYRLGPVIELNDSERGKFYISLVTKK